MKKFLSLFCTAVLCCSLAACGKNSGNSAYAGSAVTGKVTAVEDSTVTLQLGELTENEDGSRPGTPPEKPDGNSSGSGQTPPEKPDGDSNGSGQTPPEKPDGDNSGSGQTPPEKPDGDGSGSGQTPPEKTDGDSSGKAPSGGPGSSKTFTAGDETIRVDLSSASVVKNSEAAEVSDIREGDILQITFDDGGKAQTASIVSLAGGAPGNGGFGGSDTVTQGDSANTISADGTYSSTSYVSTGDDENALRIDGAAATLDGITVDKSAGATSNTENGDFYGVNAALLATNGATVTIKNAKITSSAQNGNGVFRSGQCRQDIHRSACDRGKKLHHAQ